MKIQNLMKTNSFFKKTAAMAAILTLGFAMSCQEDETPYAIEASYVAEETVTDYYFEDADDLAGLALASDEGPNSGGRVGEGPRSITINDPRCTCENLTVTITMSPNSTPEVPVGDIVIDFGLEEGCVDAAGNVRKGKILIHFVGRRFMPGSTVVTTFEEYSINGIELDGTRTLTNVTESNQDAPAFRIELADGSATWPDGTIATREHCFIREWDFNNTVAFFDDQVVVTQCANSDEWPHNYAATGTNRRGIEYEMIIVEELVYQRGCPIAVSGVKKFIEVATGKEIVIDYGDGDCDRIITITVNGNSRTVNVNRRG